MKLQALVFDVDGTLADTEETHRQAFNHAFVRFGLGWDWTPARYRQLLAISGGHERILHYIEKLPLAESEKRRLFAIVPSIHAEKTRLYTELIADGRCPLRPGVQRLIDEASEAGVALAIASTTTGANVDALLTRHLGARGRARFRAIACAAHVARKKPAPDVYRLVVAMLGRSAVECAAFEDSRNGILAAKACGIFTVVTPTPWTEGSDFSEADLVLPHLGCAELPLPHPFSNELRAPWLRLDELERRIAALPLAERAPHGIARGLTAPPAY